MKTVLIRLGCEDHQTWYTCSQCLVEDAFYFSKAIADQRLKVRVYMGKLIGTNKTEITVLFLMVHVEMLIGFVLVMILCV